jgi:hypothetical protein
LSQLPGNGSASRFIARLSGGGPSSDGSKKEEGVDSSSSSIFCRLRTVPDAGAPKAAVFAAVAGQSH